MERTPSGLIIPGGGSLHPYLRDELYYCAVCASERRAQGDDPLGFTKAEAEQYQRHVVDCAARHEEELRGLSLREQAPGVFGDEGWDVEQERWIKEHAEQILEGRLKP
jgi:hypothetical protein